MATQDINKVIAFESTASLCEKWNDVITCENKAFDMVKDLMPKVRATQKPIVALQMEQLEKLVLASETTQSGDIAQFSPILIPMLRRITPSLMATEMFGVQPLSAPTGLIYCMRAVYAGTGVNPVKRPNSQIVVLNDATNFTVGGKITTNGGVAGEVVYKEGNSLLVKITSNSGADRIAINDEVDNADPFSASETTVKSQTSNEALFKFVFKNYTGSYTTAEGEVLTTDMKEIGVTVDQAQALAKSRKMKASFTKEMADDLQSQHGLDAVTLFTQIGSEEVILELNREMIDYADAKSVLGGLSQWDYATADGRWEIEKYQNLAAKISRVSRDIAKSTRRGQGNWMIVDTTTLTALEMSGRLDTTGVDPVLTNFAGIFNGYIKVFVDLYQENTQIVMGYKGLNETDAGVFYSPYVPLMITSGKTDEGDQPRLFFRMRYAITDNPYGAEAYFRKIELVNLPL